MNYLAIMMTDPEDATKIGKVATFKTRKEADSHITQYVDQYPNAFVVEEPTLPYAQQECIINVKDKTLFYDRNKYNAQQKSEIYIYKRKSEYPTIEECVHAILDGELDDLQNKRQAVKNKYPKGDN
jgi:hypothetical protein